MFSNVWLKLFNTQHRQYLKPLARTLEIQKNDKPFTKLKELLATLWLHIKFHLQFNNDNYEN